jgi:hypothetical protein
MKKILSQPAVSHLYKYRSCKLDWLKPVITKSELYFSTPDELNDPAEAKPRLAKLSLDKICNFLYDMFVITNPGLSPKTYQFTKAQIEYNGAQFGTDVLLKEMSKVLHAEFMTIRIYSMSKRPDNMALWAKYADDHKGYCLEFSNSGLFSAAREVDYLNTNDFDPTDPDQRDVYFLFEKTLDWQTEEEVRLVTPRGAKSIINFNPGLLTKLIIGQYMSDMNIKIIRNWANLRSPKLPLVRVEYDTIEHKLNFNPMP